MMPSRTRFTTRSSLAGALVLLCAFGADAALTTPSCLAKKRQAWSTLRKCQAVEDVKRLKGKPADPVKCQTQFQGKLANIDAKAADAAIECRYGDNGDQTVTDYDTGLMWEQKDGTVGGLCLFVPGEVSHCVNTDYNWEPAFAYIAGTSGDDFVVTPFLAAHSDWRMPTIAELRGILDTGATGCGSGSPCIDPVFGATVPGPYWSSTMPVGSSTAAWCLSFRTGEVARCFIGGRFWVRAVRAGL
jgi:hypothetical protein